MGQAWTRSCRNAKAKPSEPEAASSIGDIEDFESAVTVQCVLYLHAHNVLPKETYWSVDAVKGDKLLPPDHHEFNLGYEKYVDKNIMPQSDAFMSRLQTLLALGFEEEKKQIERIKAMDKQLDDKMRDAVQAFLRSDEIGFPEAKLEGDGWTRADMKRMTCDDWEKAIKSEASANVNELVSLAKIVRFVMLFISFIPASILRCVLRSMSAQVATTSDAKAEPVAQEYHVTFAKHCKLSDAPLHQLLTLMGNLTLVELAIMCALYHVQLARVIQFLSSLPPSTSDACAKYFQRFKSTEQLHNIARAIARQGEPAVTAFIADWKTAVAIIEMIPEYPKQPAPTEAETKAQAGHEQEEADMPLKGRVIILTILDLLGEQGKFPSSEYSLKLLKEANSGAMMSMMNKAMTAIGPLMGALGGAPGGAGGFAGMAGLFGGMGLPNPSSSGQLGGIGNEGDGEGDGEGDEGDEGDEGENLDDTAEEDAADLQEQPSTEAVADSSATDSDNDEEHEDQEQNNPAVGLD